MYSSFNGNIYYEDIAYLNKKTAKNNDFIISDLINGLKESPVALGLFDFCDECDVSFHLDKTLNYGSSYYLEDQRKAFISAPSILAKKSKNIHIENTLSTISLLRSIWHYHHGLNLTVEMQPYDFVKLYKYITADIEIISLYIAWQLKISNNHDLWRYHISHENGDMALVFLRAIEKNPISQFDGTVLNASYSQWFANINRVSSTEHKALELLDRLLLSDDFMDIVFNMPDLENAFFQQIGGLPQGVNYLENKNFSKKWYKGFKDPVNKTHLSQIIEEYSL